MTSLRLSILQFIPIASLLLAMSFLFPAATRALPSPALIKSTGPTVYYYAMDGKRYVFPNYDTFASWYPDGSPPEIRMTTPEELASIPLGGNVVYRPGIRMVKINTDPKTYAVSRYGVLHWVTSEALANALYGPQWNTKIADIPDVFFTNYTVGTPITSAMMYVPAIERASVVSVQDNFLAPAPSPSPSASTPTPPPPPPSTTYSLPPTASPPPPSPSTPGSSVTMGGTTTPSPTTIPAPTTAPTTSAGAPPAAGFAISSENPLSCTSAKTLESLMTCIVSHFGPFVAPSETAKADFRTVTRAMLDGGCDAIALPSSLAGIYAVRSFTDTDTSKTVCVLMEIKDADGDGAVDRGWGTVIVNNAPTRELNIAIMHPMDDWKTEDQGIGIFKASNSRSFFVAGARRYVGTPSACEPDDAHSSSDAAHNTAMMMFSATQEIDAWYGSRRWNQLQFHGMGADACSGVDVYITNGKNLTPTSGDIILNLKANILKEHPTWSINVPGDSPGCSLSATTNVEGRFLNGVSADAVCATPATTYSQKFFSLEQAPGFRKAADWIAIINATW